MAMAECCRDEYWISSKHLQEIRQKKFVLALVQCQITTVSDVLLGITLYPTDAVRPL
jgi:hypothetical protein